LRRGDAVMLHLNQTLQFFVQPFRTVHRQVILRSWRQR
jgi:hypothetical protein